MCPDRMTPRVVALAWNVCLTLAGSFTLSGLIEGELSIFLMLFWESRTVYS
jgi:hypothetical protein